MRTTQIAERLTDRPTRTVQVSKRFKTTPDVTARTAAVADAFGVGVDTEQENVLYDETPFTFAKGDIVYITGESGGGKSVLFRELRGEFAKTRRVLDANDIKIDDSVPLIEQAVFKSLEDAMGTLAQVGLGDAYLFLARFNTLSDGQKFRARLAMLLASDADVWTCDEFTSALDRETAQVVAFTFQKAARRAGKTLIVATAHSDLTESLGPDVLVRKNYGPTVQVSYPEDKPVLPVWERLEFHRTDGKGGVQRYYQSDLAHFHYRGHKVAGVREMIFAYDPVEDRDVGVIIGTVPAFENANRAVITQKAYVRNLDAVNRDMICISRVVVLPKYRSIGLGQHLVREFLAGTAYPYVETLAEMAKTNPFFQKAGMTLADDVGGPNDRRFAVKAQFVELGADPQLVRSYRYVAEFLDTMDPEVRTPILEKSYPLINAHYARYGGKGSRPEWASDRQDFLNAGPENWARGFVGIFSPRPAYLYWMRPGWTPEPARETTAGLGSHNAGKQHADTCPCNPCRAERAANISGAE